mmetsp:Transcript_51642/g.159160  ORF Transcript_51642/g.159160 Transcript_51642/m.159160 type:complete len:200 (-) Transcript_51642:86-685(-)
MGLPGCPRENADFPNHETEERRVLTERSSEQRERLPHHIESCARGLFQDTEFVRFVRCYRSRSTDAIEVEAVEMPAVWRITAIEGIRGGQAFVHVVSVVVASCKFRCFIATHVHGRLWHSRVLACNRRAPGIQQLRDLPVQQRFAACNVVLSGSAPVRRVAVDLMNAAGPGRPSGESGLAFLWRQPLEVRDCQTHVGRP